MSVNKTLVCVAIAIVSCVKVAFATAPIATMLAISVPKNSEIVIPLPGYDADGDKLTVHITAIPDTGAIHQISQIYSDFGYEPKRGVQITAASAASPVLVTGSKHRVVYTPPAHTNEPDGKWSVFRYTVTDKTQKSEEGIVWLVPPHRQMVFSDFATGIDGWSIVRNGQRAAVQTAGGLTYEPYSRGVLNHYILGTDAEINSDRLNNNDRSLWEFVAPAKFLGNHISAYGGKMVFAMASAAGDFSESNLNSDAKVVILECSSCASGSGIRLTKFAGADLVLDGKSKQVSIPLRESEWRKDPNNTLLPWTVPTACEMVEVLAGLTSVRILGDHTKWYESVAIDRVGFVAGNSVPVTCSSIYY